MMPGGWNLDERKKFETLFKRYWRPVFSFFRNRRCSPEDASDLSQETFLEVFKSLTRFKEDQAKGLVLTIAKRRWLNKLRDDGAGKRSADVVSLDADDFLDSIILSSMERKDDALEAVIAEEMRRSLRRAVDDLPPQMRQVMRLRLDQRLKYHEIAAVLQINIQTVKSHLSQAKERLQDALLGSKNEDRGDAHGER